MLSKTIYYFFLIFASALNANAYDSKFNSKLLKDPLWEKSWFLHPDIQHPSMKILTAWREGYSGKGVVVTVIEDGLEYTHPDIRENYDPKASYDFNDNDNDPLPRKTTANENSFGTRMAGLIAASANNSVCSAGVANKASIGGIRLKDKDATDEDESQALSFKRNYIDIYVSAWGPEDDGKTIEGPGPMAKQAILDGIKHGRNGKGSIYVWATGNGGRRSDDCNCDGYSNSKYTIGIGSVNSEGKKTWYGETCSAMMAVTYSGGLQLNRTLITTELNARCSTQENGNGASGSLAAGICALALEANPDLTWRDMQHLIVRTANSRELESDDWIVNAADRKVSRTFGFGMMDAHAMVMQAKNWVNVPKQRICKITVKQRDRKKEWSFNKNYPANIQIPTFICDDGGVLPDRLEHVELAFSTVKMLTLGHLSIHLTSPRGTKSTLLGNRAYDYYYRGFKNWTLMSVQFWDENPINDWTLTFEHTKRKGTVYSPLTLILYGTLNADWIAVPISKETTENASVLASNGEAQKNRDSTTMQSMTDTTSPHAPIQSTTDTASRTVHPTNKTAAPLSTSQSTPGKTAVTPTTLSDGDIIAKKMLRDFKYIICKTRCNALRITSRGTETCTCVY